jgi:hypothetical protein
MCSTTDEVIVGYPILQIRKLLRAGQDGEWEHTFVARILHVDATTAQQIIANLEAEGYIERMEEVRWGIYWHNTLKGNALANASAAGPITRATAERNLQEFLARVEQVNTSDTYAYAVRKVVVFGSYLTTTPTLNDIELALELIPKSPDPQHMRRWSEQRVQAAKDEGKTFMSAMDALFWPLQEVLVFLKARLRALSLHHLHEQERLLEEVPTKVIYELADQQIP